MEHHGHILSFQTWNADCNWGKEKPWLDAASLKTVLADHVIETNAFQRLAKNCYIEVSASSSVYTTILYIWQVWNSNMLMDGFIGQAEVTAPINPSYVQVELPLFGRRKEKSVEKQGRLIIQVYSDDDLTSI